MIPKKNSKPSKPKVRHTWSINPKTRVKESSKAYSRPRDKKKKKSWVDEIDWFGEIQS